MKSNAVLVAALLLAAAPAQQQTPPVFRGGTTLVPVDVKVLDKNGKPVTDLKQSDFTIFEDNVRQEIKSFFPTTLTPQPPPPGEETPASLLRNPQADPLAPKTRRTFLLVLGWDASQGKRVHGPGKGPEGAIEFVRGRLLPQDLAAAVVFNRVTDFTTDHARIEQVLDRYRRNYERLVFDIVEFHERNPRMPLPPEIQARIDAIVTGQTVEQALASIKAPVNQTNTHMRRAEDLLMRIDPKLTRRADPSRNEPTAENAQDFSGRILHLSLPDAVAEVDLLKVYAGIEYLRHLDGEKHLVLLGRRIAFEHKEDDFKLASRANDARVALDIIHTAGIEAGGEGRLALDDLFRVQSAENIADVSGGYYTGNITADKALAHLDDSTRFSYLLGYAPTNPGTDGTVRHIKVKVNRPDVTVVFHHDYSAVETLSDLDLKSLIIASRLEAGGGYESEAKDIKLQLRAQVLPRFGVTDQLRVDVTIDASRLVFSPSPDGRTAELEVEIFCGDDKQHVIGDLKQHLTIAADADTLARYMREGIPFSTRISASGVTSMVKVVVYDAGADLMGTLVVKVGSGPGRSREGAKPRPRRE